MWGLHSKIVILFSLAIFVALVVYVPQYSFAASFTTVGDLPGGMVYSVVNGTSNDGLFAVGEGQRGPNFWADGEAFRWTSPNIFQGLGDLWDGSNTLSKAFDVSCDGSVVVGNSMADIGMDIPLMMPFIWTQSDSMRVLNDLPPVQRGGKNFATGVSSDGSIVVGSIMLDGNNPYHAFRWTQQDGQTDIAGLQDNSYSFAYDVSSDGSVVVGKMLNQAFRWMPPNELEGLDGLAGDSEVTAYGVSPDGSVLVGYSGNSILPDITKEAVQWTQSGDVKGLGYLSGGGIFSIANDVSEGGTVIVGSSDSSNGLEAFIWDDVNKMRSLNDVLPSLGVNLGVYFLDIASSITADSCIISGGATNIITGDREGFVANICDANFFSPPILDPIGNIQVDARESTIQISARPVSGCSVSFSVMGPSFVTINDNGDGTAELEISPECSDVGDHSLIVTASDPNVSAENSEQLTLSVEECFAVNTVDYEGIVGEYSSIALDKWGRPHISYYDRTNGDLKYAKLIGDSWRIETVDKTEVVGYTSLALDSDDNPHIAYSGIYDVPDGTVPALKFAKWFDASGEGDESYWGIVTIADLSEVQHQQEARHISLALDLQNRPHVAYERFNPSPEVNLKGDLMYVQLSTNSEVVEKKRIIQNHPFMYPSIAIDVTGVPYISYVHHNMETELDELKIYHKPHGSGWVDPISVRGKQPWIGYATLAIESLPGNINLLHIGFSDKESSSGDPIEGVEEYIKHAFSSDSGNSWTITTVDNKDPAGSFSDLALDSNGVPHMSYFSQYDNVLRYAIWDGSKWQKEDVNLTCYNSQVEDPSTTSIVIDGTSPRISYFAHTDLRYVESGNLYECAAVPIDPGTNLPDTSEVKVPEIVVKISWFNIVMKWWSDGIISDDEMANGIKYLTENKIISAP